VTITGISMGEGVAGSFYCTEKASELKFAVPPVVLLHMPASGSGPIGGTLAVHTSANGRFTASGIDLGTISSSVASSKSVSYK